MYTAPGYPQRMTQLEEFRAQMDKLKARREEYKGRLRSAGSASEREALRQKLRTYGTMIRELQEQIDHLDPPKERKARARKNRRLDIGAMSFDFFERSGACWSDLEGHSWEQVEAGDPVELGASMEQLQQWMAEGSERLTDRQRLYLDAYYNQGLSLERIAQEYCVTKSTVSRCVKRGLDRMQAWVDSKRLIADCADGRGGFDWTKYLSKVPVLTDRQRQLMLLVLSKWPKTQEELADKLELEKSTVSRTLTRAGKTVQQLGAQGAATTRPEIRNWEGAGQIFSVHSDWYASVFLLPILLPGRKNRGPKPVQLRAGPPARGGRQRGPGGPGAGPEAPDRSCGLLPAEEAGCPGGAAPGAGRGHHRGPGWTRRPMSGCKGW